jgi:branched-chain amino acid transport system substrate-binding protein
MGAVAAATVATGCGSSGGGDGSAAKSKGPIVVGAQLDLTGAADYVGIGGRYGYQMAIDEINAHGGIDGRKLKLVAEDSATTPEGGTLAARKLIQQDKVDFIMSSAASTSTLAAVPVTIGLKKPLISTVSSDPTLLDAKSKYVYRGAVPSNGASAEYMAKVAQGLSAHNVGLMIDRTNPANIKAGDVLEQAIPQDGMKVATRQGFQITDTDFTSQIAALKKANPDTVIVVTNPQAAGRVLRQMHNAGMHAKTIGDLGQSVPELVDLAGKDAVEGHTVLWNGPQWIGDDTGAMGQFKAAFKKAFPSAASTYPNFVTLWAYSDMYVMADAIKRAGGETSPDALIKAMDATNGVTVGSAPFDWAFKVGLPRTWTSSDHEGTKEPSSLVIRSGQFESTGS